MECSSGIYIDNGDIRRFLNLDLAHGDELSIKYQNTDSEVMKAAFYLDFDYQDKKYDYEIDLSGKKQVLIGNGKECDICLNSSLVKGTLVELTMKADGLAFREKSAPYGTCKNGVKINEKTVIRDFDFFSIANYYFFYKENKLYTDVDENVVVNTLPCTKITAESVLQYPAFNRNTRVKSVFSKEPIPVLDPPEKPKKPQNDILMSVIPAVVMLILTIVIRGVLSTSGGYFVIFSACTITMGIITSIITYFKGKKAYKKSLEDRETSYRNYIDEKCRNIRECREEERQLMEHVFSDIEHDLQEVADFSGALFGRLPGDEDFLCVRLGTGSMPALRKVEYKVQERFVSDDELTYLPAKVQEEYRNIEEAPVVVNLCNANAVGFVGEDEALYGLAGNVIINLAVHQYYGDVSFAFIMNEEQKERFSWVRFLPHVFSDGNIIRNIACDADSRTALFERLYKEFAWRESCKKNNSFRHIVVFVLDDMGIKRHPISKYIPAASEINVTFLFWENKKEELPLWCSYIVNAGTQNGTLTAADNENAKTEFSYTPVTGSEAEKAAVRLSPVFCEEVNLEEALLRVLLFLTFFIFLHRKILT